MDATPTGFTERRGAAVTIALLVLALTAFRLWLASHLQLAEDEAYYWLWAREPALGYFDHPPMVAWWIAAGRAVLGDTEFAVRALGVLSLLPATWLMFRIHELLFASRARALTSVLWMHATLFAAVGGVVMSPDTPLVLFWTLAVYGLAKILRSGGGWWWLLVGLAVGLGMLSKFSAVFLALGILIWLIVVPDLRRWFARIELYLGGLVAAAVLAPNLVWNAEHGWIAFARQFRRLGREGLELRFIGDFIGGQLGLLTPVIFTFCAAAIGFATYRAFANRKAEWVLISALTVPLILVLLEYGLHDRVQANWTAMIVPLAVIAGVEVGHEERDSGWWRSFRLSSLRVAAPIGYAVSALVYAQAIFDIVPDRGTNDPTSRLKGWEQLAAEVATTADSIDARWVATTNYGLNALLSFYMPEGGPPVVQVTERDRYQDMERPSDKVLGQLGLYVARVRKDRAFVLERAFGLVEQLGVLERRRPGGTVEELNAYRITLPKRVPPFIDWSA